MRIGVNTLFLIPGEVGGSQTYLMETLKAMIRVSPSLELVLFTNLENHSFFISQFEAYSQVHLIQLKVRATIRSLRLVCEQLGLPQKIRQHPVDVLWSPGYTAPMRICCPQVVSILDLQYKSHPEDFTLLARIATDAMIRLAIRSCDKVITISEFSKNELLRHTSLPASQIAVTPLAAADVFAEEMSETELKIRLQRLTPGVTRYILSVANSYPHKNLHQLAEAFGMLEHRISHHLIIVGKPRLGENKLQNALNMLSNPARCLRLQAVSQKDLAALYRGADIFVFPSLYEGFGLPVLEAMKAGTPVITTRMGAISEVGGDCVFYVEPINSRVVANKILMILNTGKSEQMKWVNAAKNRAVVFSWNYTALKTIETLMMV